MEDANEDVKKEEGMLSPTSLMPTYNVSIGVYRCDINDFIKSFNLYYEINPKLVI